MIGIKKIEKNFVLAIDSRQNSSAFFKKICPVTNNMCNNNNIYNENGCIKSSIVVEREQQQFRGGQKNCKKFENILEMKF